MLNKNVTYDIQAKTPYFGALLINSHKFCYEINKRSIVLLAQQNGPPLKGALVERPKIECYNALVRRYRNILVHNLRRRKFYG